MTKVTKGKKKARVPKAHGRPTIYTSELGEEICSRLSEGESLRSICQDEEMPNWRTVMRWLIFDKHDGFCHQYARAREAQAEWCVDFASDVVLNRTRDIPLENGKGGYSPDTTAVQRDKLILEGMRWKASILAPKKYGAKIQQEVTGAEGAALIPSLSVNVKKPS